MRKILLASTSPRRKQLLTQLGLDFKVFPIDYEEKLNPRLKPKGLVESLALGKAEFALARYSGEPVIILAADTVLCLREDILIKPKSADEATRMLERLSGTEHKAVTAFALIDSETKRTVTKSSETTIWMKKLSKREIIGYVASGEPMDRAGSYALDGKGARFVEKIDGDYYTVIGLPVSLLTEELKKFGVTM